MTHDQLTEFQLILGWTRKDLGDELGISQKRLRRFLDGSQPIPRYIALACVLIAQEVAYVSAEAEAFAKSCASGSQLEKQL